MKCYCGKEMGDNTSKKPYYQITHYNEKNEIIYAMCPHGKVLIDKRDTETYKGENE